MSLQILPERLRDWALQDHILKALILINLAGTAFGFWYYGEQLAATPEVLWMFVADSPLATLLIAASFALYLADRSVALIDALAFIGNVKYGLWSVFILIYYFDTFFAGNSVGMYLFLLVSHLGMVVQAFLVLEYIDVSGIALSLAGSWFLLNDFLDYQFDLHTRIYAAHGHPVSPAMIAAVVLTVGAWLVLFIQFHRTRQETG